MLVDILILTGMLYLSAGIANPFALFYFVNIAVAGAIVTPAWAWGVCLATVCGVGLLLIRSLPINELSSASLLAASPDSGFYWTIPKIGFFVSFATCSGIITYFITILTGELRQREQALKDAEDARIRNRQLEALATLAAGAAHELASPLSTIAVVAKELSRALEKQHVPESVTKDVALIRAELDRCRQILDRMTSTAGEAAGEKLRTISIDDFPGGNVARPPRTAACKYRSRPIFAKWSISCQSRPPPRQCETCSKMLSTPAQPTLPFWSKPRVLEAAGKSASSIAGPA